MIAQANPAFTRRFLIKGEGRRAVYIFVQSNHLV